MKILLKSASLFFLSILLFSCETENQVEKEPEYEDWKKMEVTASAYNSLKSQTKKGNVGLAAWGDTLKPGMKAIAVSRDLISQGLDHNTRIKIEGMEGYYLVKDKMNKRWKNKIDIYMGTDVQKAREWGKQQLKIYVDTIKTVEL